MSLQDGLNGTGVSHPVQTVAILFRCRAAGFFFDLLGPLITLNEDPVDLFANLASVVTRGRSGLDVLCFGSSRGCSLGLGRRASGSAAHKQTD